MRCVTSKRRLQLLVVSALLLSLAACDSGPLPPTPTAIPLAATATLQPRPTRPPATPSPAVLPVPTGGQPEFLPTRTTAASLAQLNDLLAQQTAYDFLARLAAGKAAAAFRLYLTPEAQQGQAGSLVAQFTSASPALAEARLIEFRPATAASYEARVLLRWSGDAKNPAATQAMTLTLAYRRGLWLIDRISLGDRQTGP